MKAWNRRSAWFTAAILMCAVLAGHAALADDAATGRDIASKWGSAVVKVQLVIKVSISYMGQADTQESKGEVTGTVVDPSGLTIVSFTNTNPADAIRGMFGGEDGPDITSEVTDVKILLNDGKEIPAKVVLRDKDLDLAFIQPIEKLESPLMAVDLKNSGSLDMLDKAIILSRLGRVANRSQSVHLTHIQAVINKPRKFYTITLPDKADVLGSPVFGLDGKVIGLVLLRILPGQASMDSSRSETPIMPIIIPAEDIAPAAAQAAAGAGS